MYSENKEINLAIMDKYVNEVIASYVKLEDLYYESSKYINKEKHAAPFCFLTLFIPIVFLSKEICFMIFNEFNRLYCVLIVAGLIIACLLIYKLLSFFYDKKLKLKDFVYNDENSIKYFNDFFIIEFKENYNFDNDELLKKYAYNYYLVLDECSYLSEIIESLRKRYYLKKTLVVIFALIYFVFVPFRY